MSYDELPAEAQQAVRVYMLDGLDSGGFDSEPEMEAHLRRLRYRLEYVPTEQMKAQVMTSPDLGHGTFEAYHRWYTTTSTTERDYRTGLPRYRQHTERWPVIADDQFGTVIDDGWHRFHSYVAAGDTHIPVLHIEEPNVR